MTRNRFLTGSLASIAVAGAFTLTAPAAHAEDRGCGLPAVDAVYTSVVHAPVFRTVPAQTHAEWLWERDVDVLSYEFTTVVTGAEEYLFTRTVTDVPAVPAVPGTPELGHFDTVVTTPAVEVTEWEYEHENTGKIRWEDEDWGAQNGQGQGWKKTGSTRETVITPAVTTQVWIVDSPATPGTPAVPAVTHTESLWATSSPGADWTGPQDSRPGPTSTDTVWAATAPKGYEPTGASKVIGTEHEVTEDASAAAPAGDGWSQVVGSESEVVDVPESTELVSEGWTEQVLVSPAVPATDACVEPPAEDPTTEDPTVETPNAGTPAVETPQAAPAPSTAVASPADVLPETGNGVPPWMAPTGFAAMLAGIAMIRFGRRAGAR